MAVFELQPLTWMFTTQVYTDALTEELSVILPTLASGDAIASPKKLEMVFEYLRIVEEMANSMGAQKLWVWPCS